MGQTGPAGRDAGPDVTGLIGPVADVVREVADREVLSRFGHLDADDVATKAGEEAVTVADREAERALFRGLGALLPEALLVGEESVSADPGLLDRVADHDVVFVVDPIDGTSNFIAGSPDFAVMVALVIGGRTVASWIHQPVHERLYTAVSGGGAHLNGEPLRRSGIPDDPAAYRGALSTWGLPEDERARTADRAGAFAEMPVWPAASGIEYPRLAAGELDFILWSSTRVWDHAPGSLLVVEAGGFSGELDGSAYAPWASVDRLVVASSPVVHRRVRAILAPDGVI